MLKKFWIWFVGGCDHNWVILEQNYLVDGESGVGTPYGKVFYLQCSECGNVKRRILS